MEIKKRKWERSVSKCFCLWLKGALLRSYNQHCCSCPSFGSMLSLIFLLLCDGVLALQPLWLSPQVLDLGPVLRTGNKESWPHPRINEIFFLKMLPKTWINQSFILLIALNQDLMISPKKQKKPEMANCSTNLLFSWSKNGQSHHILTKKSYNFHIYTIFYCMSPVHLTQKMKKKKKKKKKTLITTNVGQFFTFMKNLCSNFKE
jgi:hypothetical protein